MRSQICLSSAITQCIDKYQAKSVSLNALAESFFATLACERLDRSRFRTQEQAEMAVFACIVGWFNPHRRHAAIGYLSPMEYERRQARESPLPQSSTVH
jgi:transposase InsO family protein